MSKFDRNLNSLDLFIQHLIDADGLPPENNRLNRRKNDRDAVVGLLGSISLYLKAKC